MGFVAVGELIEVAPNLIEEANGYQWRQIVGSGYWVAERVKDGERYFDVVAEPDPLPDPEPPPEDEVILFNEIFSEDSEGGFWQMASGGVALDGGLVHFEVHVIRRSAASAIGVVLYCEGEDIQEVRLVPGMLLWRGQG